MLTAADFSPSRARRRRRIVALTTAMTTVTALGAFLVDDSPTLPRPPTAMLEVTSLAPHVVVYSVPTSATHDGKSHSDTNGDGTNDGTDSGTQAHGGSATSPSTGSNSGSEVGGASSQTQPGSAATTWAPVTGPNGSTMQVPCTTRVTDPAALSQAVAAAGNGNAVICINGSAADPAQTPGAGYATPPTSVGGSTQQALPAQPATPQPTAPDSPTTLSPQSYGPASAAQAVSPPTAQQAQLLMQIQCPASMPAGSFCFEATTTDGAAATLPPAPNLGGLPVVTAPGSAGPACQAQSSTGSASDQAAGSNASGNGGAESSGTSTHSGKNSGDSTKSGDSKNSGDSKDSGSSKDSGDSSDSDTSDTAAFSSTPTATVSSCGLLGTSFEPGTVGPASVASGASQAAKDVIPGSLSKIPTGSPQQVLLRTTGYSYQDNTPRNSDTISCSTIHKVAGGDGTYDNPISVAVPGHSGQGAQINCGTRIYYKDFQFYGIVEDTGATDFPGQKHTDIYVDGKTPASDSSADQDTNKVAYTASQSEKCMNPVTKDSVSAILNPPPGLPTRPPGPITQGDTCDVGTSGGVGSGASS